MRDWRRRSGGGQRAVSGRCSRGMLVVRTAYCAPRRLSGFAFAESDVQTRGCMAAYSVPFRHGAGLTVRPAGPAVERCAQRQARTLRRTLEMRPGVRADTRVRVASSTHYLSGNHRPRMIAVGARATGRRDDGLRAVLIGFGTYQFGLRRGRRWPQHLGDPRGGCRAGVVHVVVLGRGRHWQADPPSRSPGPVATTSAGDARIPGVGQRASGSRAHHVGPCSW